MPAPLEFTSPSASAAPALSTHSHQLPPPSLPPSLIPLLHQLTYTNTNTTTTPTLVPRDSDLGARPAWGLGQSLCFVARRKLTGRCGWGGEGSGAAMVRRGRSWAVVVVVVVLFFYGGCGAGGTTQEDFRQRAADKVERLPGQPPVTFNQWAGYVNVEDKIGRFLFYYFGESPKNASTKPLVLWLNGGPGCSSMGLGWAYELGPFHIRENGTGLETNIQSWNRYVNLLFLESPTGVGFSYSNDQDENHFGGDTRTAEDSYNFLVGWFDRFPEYKDRDFYITGESYAGHYVPQLAALIHERNKDAKQKINLKGIMVGNPSTDQYYDNVGAMDYWLSHALISPETHDELSKACNYSDPNCCSQQCNDIYYYASQVEIGGIDFYSIDTPACTVNANGTPLRRRLYQTSQANKMKRTNPFLQMKAAYDPCYINGVAADIYFNRQDVQKALHANVSGQIPYNWTSCSIDLSYTEQAFTVLPLYKELIAGGYKIWLYSGDNDAVVPVTGTIYALEALNLPVTVPWYAWYQKEQVGGRSQWYNGITFVTFRGAGHEVPIMQPGKFLTLLKFFLLGEQLPGDPYN